MTKDILVQNSQSYKEDYGSFRTFLWVILIIEILLSTLFYYSQYKSNKHHFFQSYQQEKERIIADSVYFLRELEIEKKNYTELVVQRENKRLETRYLGKILNILADPKLKLPDTLIIEKTQSYVTINKINNETQDGDTIFNIFLNIDSTNIRKVPIPLRLKYDSFSKYPNKSNSNSGDNFIAKLETQYLIAKNALTSLCNNTTDAEKKIRRIESGIKDVQSGGSLDVIDFFVFTGNIHTSLGFNGITPASKSMRLICLIHKLLVIFLYYLLLTKFKNKKD